MVGVLEAAIVLALSIVASFIGSIVGGGGLIMIPSFIFLGFPADMAIATTRFGTLGYISALRNYWKSKAMLKQYITPFTIITILTSIIGANVLVSIDKQLLMKLVGVALLIPLPFILFKKDLGILQKKKVNTKAGYLFYTLASLWGAFFGGGGGVFILYALIFFFGFTMLQSSATNAFPRFLLSVITVSVFAYHGIIDYTYGFIVLVGILIGGHIGTKTALKKGNKWIKILFTLVIVASAIKLLFF